MKYENIKKAKFISRPNRFIANVELDGKIEVCHVKNTGRCKELLVEGANVFVQEFDKASRKTKYDLIGVYKGKRLINMDSQVPNQVVHEWLLKGNLFENITLIKPESKYQSSRFDFYLEADEKKIFIEVKGVTLEEDGIVLFPDAPTQRGVKHILELCQCIEEGFEAYVIFVIQMQGVKYFTPNRKTHEAFAQALVKARGKGVKLMAIDCMVGTDFIEADRLVEIKL